MTTKLTLSVDPVIIAKAHRISKRHHTSISAIFSNYISSLEEDPAPPQEFAPITRRILEMGEKLSPGPSDWNYRDELSDSMMEKYGVK